MNFKPRPKKVPAPTGPGLLTTFLVNFGRNLQPERFLAPGFVFKQRNRDLKNFMKATLESKYSKLERSQNAQ